MNASTPHREDIAHLLLEMGQKTRIAGYALAKASDLDKNDALTKAAGFLDQRRASILSANHQDVQAGQEKGLDNAMLDRLKLDGARLDGIIEGLHNIIALPDPVGSLIAEWSRPNGLQITRTRTPLGVLGVIYESRPNVTIDAGALCLKSGNGVILRGGSESLHSSAALHACLVDGLVAAGLPGDAVNLVPVRDRAAVGHLLAGLDGNIDVIIPRGGKSLVARVQEEARIPVIGHLDGRCHIYVDGAADLEMAINVTVNAKMRRPGICGAAETLLVDKAIAATALPALTDALIHAGCVLRGDQTAQQIDSRIAPATEEDWWTEYLAPILSVAVVTGVAGAIAHIDRYASGHTESIITQDSNTAECFLAQVDSAIVMHNASTQFADGGEFGMGAEIGIATGRIHARGPVGLEQLTTFKYQVRGNGQTRD